MATDPKETPAEVLTVPRRKYPHAPQPTAQPPADDAHVATGSSLFSDPSKLKTDEEDPRARAARRADELREHLGGLDDGVDDFYIDPRDIPDGWCYEWKRHTTLGAEDPAYEVQIARAGWEAVPVSRHPKMMPKDYPGMTILRKGMMLMERPQEIVDEAKAIELRKARAQVRQKEIQLRGAPAGDNSPFSPDNKGSSLVNIKKSFEPMSIPKE
jgi:hypothetical protein